jgi:hypothetical protein
MVSYEYFGTWCWGEELPKTPRNTVRPLTVRFIEVLKRLVSMLSVLIKFSIGDAATPLVLWS